MSRAGGIQRSISVTRNSRSFVTGNLILAHTAETGKLEKLAWQIGPNRWKPFCKRAPEDHSCEFLSKWAKLVLERKFADEKIRTDIITCINLKINFSGFPKTENFEPSAFYFKKGKGTGQ